MNRARTVLVRVGFVVDSAGVTRADLRVYPLANPQDLGLVPPVGT